MIGILIAVMVVVGIVAATDLLLSFAVIRRLAALQSGSGTARGGNADSPAIGHRIGEFSVDLITGGEFTAADLTGARVMVVFLTLSCEPCQKAIAELQAMPVPLSWPLYVLVAGPEEGGDLFAMSAGMPRGAHVGAIGAVDATTRAFGIEAFPTMLTIEDGIVRTSGFRVSSMLEHASL